MTLYSVLLNRFFFNRYTASHFEGHSYETILFLSEILSTDALVLNSGSLSSSLTAEGLLRFPAGTKKQKSMVEGILNIMSSEFDWEKERDFLNATDMKVIKIDCRAYLKGKILIGHFFL